MLQHILSRDIYQNPESHLRQTVQPTHTEGMFTAVLKRGISIKNDTVNDAVNDTVNSKEQEVLNIIKQYPGLNSSKIAELIGKSVPTTKRYLNSLVRLEIIEFRGAQRNGGYYIV